MEHATRSHSENAYSGDYEDEVEALRKRRHSKSHTSSVYLPDINPHRPGGSFIQGYTGAPFQRLKRRSTRSKSTNMLDPTMSTHGRKHWAMLETGTATRSWLVTPEDSALTIPGLVERRGSEKSPQYEKESKSQSGQISSGAQTVPVAAAQGGEEDGDRDRFHKKKPHRGSLRPPRRTFGLVTDKACQTEPHIFNTIREGRIDDSFKVVNTKGPVVHTKDMSEKQKKRILENPGEGVISNESFTRVKKLFAGLVTQGLSVMLHHWRSLPFGIHPHAHAHHPPAMHAYSHTHPVYTCCTTGGRC